MANGKEALICSVCGTENRPGAKFCTECGSPFAAPCPTCGTVNPPGAKFCSECATPLQATAEAPQPTGPEGTTPSEPVAERRVVSVLFADLVGFTPFAEERDAEEVRETLSRYFDLASDLIGRYGGTVEKFIGDAVMAVWGAPVAREDDAERAVRAALELIDAIGSLGPGIQARAGVLTGEAAVTIGATNQGMVAGDLVNTAARLQAAATPGTVLVGEATQRSAAAAIVFEPAGDKVLKGKQAPMAAWQAVRVVAERGGRNRSGSMEAPFVGRDEQLRLLKDQLHATKREGKSRLVSIMGPAGIGKTRLAWEFQKYVDGLAENVWWHAGRSPAYGDSITFWALGEMIRGRAGLVETDAEPLTRERVSATVLEHVPDATEAQWIEGALLALLGVGPGDVATGSDELFAAWRTFFERLAATSPVVLVFEDFHHADTGLLDFVDHLMEWSRGVPITVVTLARPELLERRPDWGAAKRAFTSIHLEPLAPADMEQLLGGLVPGLPTAVVDRIVARADGIPLYAVETVRMLLALGEVVQEGDAYRPAGDLDQLAIPETLTALIAARLDGLKPADRAVVEDAAVLGQSFSVTALAAVSGQPAETLEARLGGLVRRELLVLDLDPRSPERGQYAFVQALIREVAYNTLSKKDRKVRHLAAARHFESLATDELAAGLAGHYLAAQRLAADEGEANALAAQTRIALRGAAERAAALGSHEQARRFLEQALEVTTDPADRADLHARALEAASAQLEPEPVLQHAAAAEAEWRRTGDREAIAIAAVTHAMAYGGSLNDPARGLEMVERTWNEFSDLEMTQAGLEMMAGFLRAYRGLADQRNNILWTDRYLAVAERIGTLEQIARGILSRGIGLAVSGQPRQGIILLRGAHQLALAHDFREVEGGCRGLLTFYEQWGDPVAGAALGREGLEIGRRLGSRAYQFGMVGNSCICAIRTGDWAWAAELLEEWLDLETAGSYWSELHMDRALLAAHQGADPTADLEAAARLRGSITDPQYESYDLLARAAWSLACGDFGTAVEQAELAVAKTDYFAPLAYPLAARAALWAGDAGAARRITDTLAALTFWGPVLEADQTRMQAGLAALEGRSVEAIAGFREALRAYRGLGVAFDEAAAAVDLAVVLGPGDRATPEVAGVLESAREVLTRLDARPYLARLEEATSGDGSAARGRAPRTDSPVAHRSAG